MKRKSCPRSARGRGLLVCVLLLGVAAPQGLAQTPPVPQPDPAPTPDPKPAPAPAQPVSTPPPPAPVVSAQPPEPVVREKPRKRKRAKNPAPARVFLSPTHAPDPGPAVASVLHGSSTPLEAPIPLTPIPAAATTSDEPLPVLPVLAIIAAVGLVLASLAAAPGWVLARISGSLARQRMDIAFVGFVLLAGLATAFLISMA